MVENLVECVRVVVPDRCEDRTARGQQSLERPLVGGRAVDQARRRQPDPQSVHVGEQIAGAVVHPAGVQQVQCQRFADVRTRIAHLRPTSSPGP